jgi:uncharacterized membrane protein YfhO
MGSADFNPAQTAVIVADGSEHQLGEGEGQVEIINYQAERIELAVNTTDSGLLVLAEANYPGWKVAVDGQDAEILQTDGLFRGVMIPAGQHEVVFGFNSRSYQIGLLITIISAAFFLGAFFMARKWA